MVTYLNCSTVNGKTEAWLPHISCKNIGVGNAPTTDPPESRVLLSLEWLLVHVFPITEWNV